jgi:large subunit ribosomal protein L17
MRHGVKTKKLGKKAEHRKAMLNNLATSILRQGLSAVQMDRKVITTVPKAKVVRGLVDRLITYAKKGDLSARRQAAKFVHDSEVLQGLFSDLGPRYAKRPGGYTRVLKVAENRHGDNAEMALITLVEDEISPRRALKKSAKATAPVPAKKAAAKKKVDITKNEAKAESTDAAAPEAPAA